MAIAGIASAIACSPDDFLCSAFPAPKDLAPKSKALPLLAHSDAPRTASAWSPPADPKVVDYLAAFSNSPPTMKPETERRFLVSVFEHFDELPVEWKRAVCTTTYPDALRNGTIDLETHKGFYEKCKAFAMRDAAQK